MRKLTYALGVAGIAMLALADRMPPAEAAIIYPWCAHYGGRSGGGVSCGSSTFAQCMATVSGMGGGCEMNPIYEPPPSLPVRKQKRARGS
jgi:hypothetical protein